MIRGLESDWDGDLRANKFTMQTKRSLLAVREG